MSTSNLKLATATVGDLLLHSKISKGQNGKPIDGVKLSIPEYQRPYSWTAQNATQLLDDIIEAKSNNKEVYRVGTLILHEEKDKEKQIKYNIVDGQQRSITLALLLYALQDTDSHMDIPILNEKISTTPESRNNIPTNLNAFKRRVKKDAEDTNSDEQDMHRRQMREVHKSNMRELSEYIKTQCEFIVIITDNLSEAFQFFDSQNSRGKALYPHDLLKAYHLREMCGIEDKEVERIVKLWEEIPQDDLNKFFGEYIYRIKEWTQGNIATKLDEHTLYKFKGITNTSHSPYAKFYKSAYAYANFVNNSAMPFVTGTRQLEAFQLTAPIIAGKPFFEYTQHYYKILKDIRDNSKYEGFYINDNEIVKTLDSFYNYGTGNSITRLLFDTALLVYIDRFCPATHPTKEDVELFEQFVIYAFVWAYSLRAQYSSLGWKSAQNYILGYSDKINACNIYKIITSADSPILLISILDNTLIPLKLNNVDNVDEKRIVRIKGTTDSEERYSHYLHFFKQYNFLQE